MNFMRLLINKDYNPAYTERELFEEKFPELLNKSFETVLRLKDIQQKIVEMLPQLKRQLPSNEELQSTEGKLNLLTYILVRSLYGFANKIWITIDKQCDDFADEFGKEEVFKKSPQELMKMIAKWKQYALHNFEHLDLDENEQADYAEHHKKSMHKDAAKNDDFALLIFKADKQDASRY